MDAEQAKSCAQPVPARPSGISTAPNQPPTAFGVDTVTTWYGTVNGQDATVWSGSEPAAMPSGPGNPSTGVVVEFLRTGSMGDPRTTQRETVANSGALTITSVSGDILTLSGAKGGKYHFDATSHTLTQD
ncbi:MAG: hypothetical protein ACYCS7_06110 [Acidimicrobiales bacterium]